MSTIRRRRSSFVIAGAVLAALGGAACSSNAPAVGESGEPIVRFSGLPDPAPRPVIVLQGDGPDEKDGLGAECGRVGPDHATTSVLMRGLRLRRQPHSALYL